MPVHTSAREETNLRVIKIHAMADSGNEHVGCLEH